MWKNNKIEVLSGIRWMFRLTNLYNKIGDSVGMPDIFIFFMICLPTFYYVLLCVWVVIEEKFNLKMISTNLANAICVSQVTIAYISMATKTGLITSTIDHLQEFVEKSK